MAKVSRVWPGMLIALALVAVVGDWSGLQARSGAVDRGQLDPELRLACDAGLIAPARLEPRWLAAPMQRGEFAWLLRQVLGEMGHPAAESLEHLRRHGLFDPSPSRQFLRRRDAVEALARIEGSFGRLGWFAIEGPAPARFLDYRPSSALSAGMASLVQLRVIRGYPDGRLRVERQLSHREGLMLLWRLYETAMVRLMRARCGGGAAARFIDLPDQHPVRRIIADLDRLNLLNGLDLGVCFDGNARLELGQMALVLGNLAALDRDGPAAIAQAPADPIARARALGIWDDAVLGRRLPDESARRRDLALVLAKIVPAPPADSAALHGAIDHCYTDLAAGTADGDALGALARAGIILGYPDGRFAGDEEITRYEFIGVLRGVLKLVEASAGAADDGDEAVGGTRTFVQQMSERLRIRRLRVHGILSRGRPVATIPNAERRQRVRRLLGLSDDTPPDAVSAPTAGPGPVADPGTAVDAADDSGKTAGGRSHATAPTAIATPAAEPDPEMGPVALPPLPPTSAGTDAPR